MISAFWSAAVVLSGVILRWLLLITFQKSYFNFVITHTPFSLSSISLKDKALHNTVFFLIYSHSFRCWYILKLTKSFTYSACVSFLIDRPLIKRREISQCKRINVQIACRMANVILNFFSRVADIIECHVHLLFTVLLELKSVTSFHSQPYLLCL